MKNIKIGRSPSNDFVIKDSTVSSNHAILTINENIDGIVYVLKDLQSTNGTSVNGKRIGIDTIIKPTDKLKFGNYEVICSEIISDKTNPDKTILNSEILRLSQRKRIGREVSPINDIVLPYPDVSQIHAYIGINVNNKVEIVDNKSTNGTFVNGIKVDKQELRPGDKVLVANKYPISWENLFNDTRPTISFKLSYVAAALAVILVLAAFISWMHYKPLEPKEIYGKYKKTVVFIYVTGGYDVTFDGHPFSYYNSEDLSVDCISVDDEGNVSSGYSSWTGSGAFISRDGKVLTNKHVAYVLSEEEEKNKKIIETAVSTYIMANYSDGFKFLMAHDMKIDFHIKYIGIGLNDTHISTVEDLIPCTLYDISSDDKVDAAIIQIKTKKTPDDVDEIIELSEAVVGDELALGEKVYTIGFPAGLNIGSTDIGLEANNQSGEITQEAGKYLYGHNITVTHGASGSPIFDKRGRFAGLVVSGFIQTGKEYNYAVRPERILDMIK